MIFLISQGEEHDGYPGPAVDLQICPAEDDPEGKSPPKTGRKGLQSPESLQGCRADPPGRQEPGETGGAPGGQPGGESHRRGQGSAADFLLRDIQETEVKVTRLMWITGCN